MANLYDQSLYGYVCVFSNNPFVAFRNAVAISESRALNCDVISKATAWPPQKIKTAMTIASEFFDFFFHTMLHLGTQRNAYSTNDHVYTANVLDQRAHCPGLNHYH